MKCEANASGVPIIWDPKKCGHWNLDTRTKSTVISDTPYPVQYRICRDINSIELASTLWLEVDGDVWGYPLENTHNPGEREIDPVYGHLSAGGCVVVTGSRIAMILDLQSGNETFFGTFEPLDLGGSDPGDAGELVLSRWNIKTIFRTGMSSAQSTGVLGLEENTLVRVCRGLTDVDGVLISPIVDGKLMRATRVSTRLNREIFPADIAVDSCFTTFAREVFLYASANRSVAASVSIEGVVGFYSD